MLADLYPVHPETQKIVCTSTHTPAKPFSICSPICLCSQAIHSPDQANTQPTVQKLSWNPTTRTWVCTRGISHSPSRGLTSHGCGHGVLIIKATGKIAGSSLGWRMKENQSWGRGLFTTKDVTNNTTIQPLVLHIIVWREKGGECSIHQVFLEQTLHILSNLLRIKGKSPRASPRHKGGQKNHSA